MKHIKDLSKIFIFVLIMYLPLSWLSLSQGIKESNSRRTQTVLKNFADTQEMIRFTLSNNEMLEACQKLEASYRAKLITAYIVNDGTNSCYMPPAFAQIPYNIGINEFVNLEVAGTPMTITHQVTNNYNWHLAVTPPHQVNVFKQFVETPELKKALFKDILLVCYTVFTFILLAVLILTKTIQNNFKSNFKNSWIIKLFNRIFFWLQLDDLRIVKSATEALISKNEKLEKDLDLLETSLEASILNEIKLNNLKIPYSFQGAVAKVDINGFSKIVAKRQSDIFESMTTHLEQFGCELLKRYEGLFEKTIGDEIVVVFKGEDSQLKACAFVRDLMREFSSMHFHTEDGIRQFTLKSSIHYSDLTFSKRISGYGFSGEALTITTRLMDAVFNKDINNLSILEKDVSTISGLVNTTSEPILHNFKNMSAQSCMLISEFKDIDFILSTNTELLAYFKSDTDIIYLLNQINPSNDKIKLKTILDALSGISTREVSHTVIRLWFSSLDNLLHLKDSYTAHLDELTYCNLVAHFISTSLNLIPESQWLSEYTHNLLKIPTNLDGRINATVIDAIIHFDIKSNHLIATDKYIIANDSSSRVEANIIIMNALYKLENNHFDKLILMIKSSDTSRSKSGIYAAGKIISYYLNHNAAELELYASYKKLKELLVLIKSSQKIKLTPKIYSQLDAIIFD